MLVPRQQGPSPLGLGTLCAGAACGVAACSSSAAMPSASFGTAVSSRTLPRELRWQALSHSEQRPVPPHGSFTGLLVQDAPPRLRHGDLSTGACGAAAGGSLLLGAAILRRRSARLQRIARRVRADVPSTAVKLAQKPKKKVLPYVEDAPQAPAQWPQVLDPKKAKPELAIERLETTEEVEDPRKSFRGAEGKTMRKLMQTYLRMEDVGRIIRLGMSTPSGDARGWAAVALCQLKRYKEAASLASGPDGQTPCGIQTLRYVAHALAKVGALDAAMHLSWLQLKTYQTRYVTHGGRAVQSLLEVSALYLQATADKRAAFMAAHGAQVALEVEKIMTQQNDILALTPNRRYRMLTEGFNQLIRWYGRARLIPQALRACEIMNELGIPRDDMTIHFLSRGAAQEYALLKRASRVTQYPPDWSDRRPEVIFVGRTNSGKSAMINALFSCLTKFAPVNKRRAWTRNMDFYEVNRQRAGLPQFLLVDTPGLGYANIESRITKTWPDLIYDYLRNRQALQHVFHLCDARNKRLLPADRQLIHLLAKAQRRRVRYTIVITKIDVVSRVQAKKTADAIREELAPYCDVDIMYASARTLRGVDHLWSKIWQSVTNTARGRRHKELGQKELKWLREKGPGVETDSQLADLLGIPMPEKQAEVEDFDTEEWAEDRDFEPSQPGERHGYKDNWDRENQSGDEFQGFDGGDFDDDDLDDAEFEQRWNASEGDDDFTSGAATGGIHQGVA